MYEIRVENTRKLQAYEELIKVFLQPSEFRLFREEDLTDTNAVSDNIEEIPALIQDPAEEPSEDTVTVLKYREEGDLYAVARQMYRDLEEATGKAPKWGILTGIRPVKLAYELAYGAKAGQAEEMSAKDLACKVPSDPINRAENVLRKDYLLHPDKANLAAQILRYQLETAGDPPEKSLAVYVGIPFCPTRCLYCSFTSNQVPDSEILRYLEALKKEIDFAAQAAAEDGFRIESIYFGGGTPTTLNAAQLSRLLEQVREKFDLKNQPLREWTVEAGRPDTITVEKLEVLKENGVGRISINPQSMQQRTLDLIGRKHTVEQTVQAFEMARQVGFESINTDLIAGLPGEDYPAFADSLERILAQGPDNVTLHTLAVKRASRLKEMDEHFNYRQEELRERMLAHAAQRLGSEGFRPYYLYRQKHTSGNTENIGYCRDDLISVYNIRIMEERQSILALGAGGISKIWFPAQNRLERVANVSNYEIYIERIDEMMDRKRKGFFGQTK